MTEPQTPVRPTRPVNQQPQKHQTFVSQTDTGKKRDELKESGVVRKLF